MADLRNMTVAVTGATGLIGKRVCGVLGREGCRVWRVRRSGAGGGAAEWEVDTGRLRLPGRAEAIVHLAGRSVGVRWTTRVKQEIWESRVTATEKLCRYLAELPIGERPGVLVCASAVGIYGDRGEEVITEESAVAGEGTSFLADVCRGWEAAARPAEEAGIRVVKVRLGVVLAAEGGALAKMARVVKWGLGGPVGSGGQFMPWVSLTDAAGLIMRCVSDEGVRGVVNGVGPQPVRQREFMRVLGKVLHRPVVFPLPAFMVKAVFGQMGQEVLLASSRVVAGRLLGGFEMKYKTVEEAVRGELGR